MSEEDARSCVNYWCDRPATEEMSVGWLCGSCAENLRLVLANDGDPSD